MPGAIEKISLDQWQERRTAMPTDPFVGGLGSIWVILTVSKILATIAGLYVLTGFCLATFFSSSDLPQGWQNYLRDLITSPAKRIITPVAMAMIDLRKRPATTIGRN